MKNQLIYIKSVADVAELADAPDLGSGGRPWGFKSLHPHQTKNQYEGAGFLFGKNFGT